MMAIDIYGNNKNNIVAVWTNIQPGSAFVFDIYPFLCQGNLRKHNHSSFAQEITKSKYLGEKMHFHRKKLAH
jgi:hypothetical protein